MKNQKSVLISGLIALMMMFTAAFQCGRSSSTPTTSSTPRPQSTAKTTPKNTTNGRTLTEADIRKTFQDYYDGLAESHSKAYTPASGEVEYTGTIQILEKDEYDYYAVKAPHIGRIVTDADGKAQQTYDYSKPSINFYFYWKVDKWTWRFDGK